MKLEQSYLPFGSKRNQLRTMQRDYKQEVFNIGSDNIYIDKKNIKFHKTYSQ